ncbi:uncharacterized protein PFL1_00582 [Pseudozyma flocculosa PF-1]|uniref:uncharacterized protein n=1 Tax=Pseudozyma flocculosa PF-1 TaxID=1277687 RepID=UPI0004561A7D|nr:uncharacterized protein PFL1_00582 [Pseudozyma flocculosa PF-1]EPQ32386.1 hypothetical protein PFL1_00582 [Pseudozyma flocculosa PF-1]
MAATRIWHDKLQQATDTATQATKLEFNRAYSEAFEAYVRAGQLYLWLVRNLHDRSPPQKSDSDAHVGTSKDGAALLSSSFRSSLSLELSDAEMRDRLKRSAAKVMQRAEKIKSARNDVRPVDRHALSFEEQSNALAASARIGRLAFPTWTDPADDEFDAGPGIYLDSDPQPALSPTQLENRASYRRPGRRRRDQGAAEGEGNGGIGGLDADGFGRPLRGSDIVQDVVTDCSFVAALEVAAEHDRRWRTRLATAALFPKDPTGSIRPSPNGKYMARLTINGTARRVTFDDSLPCYPDGTLMCATSRTGQQTWPALLEKAYLKVMGGYDFLGSNSSIDLHALTGWIPEHVFLRHAGFQREKMWCRISEAWSKGECMVTTGTGHFGEQASPAYEGLVPSHDYAVLALIERSGRRYALLMNPWSRPIGKRPGLAVPLDEERAILAAQAGHDGQTSDGGFLVTWDDLCSHFDSIYLNWNPERFRHQLSIHSTWKGTGATANPQSVGQNPQFRLSLEPDEKAGAGAGAGIGIDATSTTDETEVWLLLVRHIEGKQSLAPDGEGNYMALHVFEHEDRQHRVYKPRESRRLGSYVDGTHNLVRVKARAPTSSGAGSTAYTVIVSRHGPSSNVSYSLSAYSSARMSLRELPHAHPYHEKVSGSWSGRSAGGNVTHPTFMNNPQYAITISPPPSSSSSSSSSAAAKPAVLCSTAIGTGPLVTTSAGPLTSSSSSSSPSTPATVERGGSAEAAKSSLLVLVESARSLPIQAQLVWSSGSRISHCVEGDLALSSGIYSHGIAVGESTSVQPGTYTLVVSTFQPGQVGPFVLSVECSTPIRIQPIPQEGAGMYARTIRGGWSKARGTAGGPPSSGAYEANPRYRLTVSRPSTFLARLKTVPVQQRLDATATTGHSGGDGDKLGPVDGGDEAGRTTTRIPEGEYVLVASTYTKGSEADFTIDVYLDRPIELVQIHA